MVAEEWLQTMPIYLEALIDGLALENSYNHLATFLEICNTMKINKVPNNVTRLNLFPFSFAGNAKVWLHSFFENILTKWDDLVKKFLQIFFTQSKVNQGRHE